VLLVVLGGDGCDDLPGEGLDGLAQLLLLVGELGVEHAWFS
jgi:hypothetical protein